MTEPAFDRETLRECVDEVQKRLGLTTAPRIEPYVLLAVRRELLAALRQARTTVRFEVHGARPHHVCLALLQHVYHVPESAVGLEDAVSRRLRELYSNCRPRHQQLIDREVIHRQWSSFPVVRRIATRLRELQPVEVDEAQALLQPLSPPEVRSSIAARLWQFKQDSHLEALLEYLLRTAGRAESDERAKAEQLLKGLGRFGRGRTTSLLIARFTRERDLETQGWLLRAITSFGHEIVPDIWREYRRATERSTRRRLLRVLDQLQHFGHVAAAVHYAKAIEQADRDELDELSHGLFHALYRLAMRDPRAHPYSQIRQTYLDLAKQLQKTRDPARQQLGQRLDEDSWLLGRDLANEVLERIPLGTATEGDRNVIRTGGVKAVRHYMDLLRDPSRTSREKQLVLDYWATQQIYGIQGDAQVGELLWALFRNSADRALGRRALAALAECGFELSPERLEVLHGEYLRGEDPELRELIRERWGTFTTGEARPAGPRSGGDR